MGHLLYANDGDPIVIPDMVLAHLKTVVAMKLRRGESFTVSWRHAPGQPPGRSTIWLQPSIPLRFVFDSPEPERLDPDLLKRLADEATSTGGLMVDLTDPTGTDRRPAHGSSAGRVPLSA